MGYPWINRFYPKYVKYKYNYQFGNTNPKWRIWEKFPSIHILFSEKKVERNLDKFSQFCKSSHANTPQYKLYFMLKGTVSVI